MFCSASVMITLGAILGKTGPWQVMILAWLETIMYGANYIIGAAFVSHHYHRSSNGVRSARSGSEQWTRVEVCLFTLSEHTSEWLPPSGSILGRSRNIRRWRHPTH